MDVVAKILASRPLYQKNEGRDPFYSNTTIINTNPSIEASPCASGWCGKSIEGQIGDHLQATERMCLQRPPSDGQERCSDTFYEASGNKRRSPIFMCFCKGDLCNGSTMVNYSFIVVPSLIICRLIVTMVTWSAMADILKPTIIFWYQKNTYR